MTALLWTLSAVGVWNGINIAARVYYKAPWHQYSYHVVVGAWAIIILIGGEA